MKVVITFSTRKSLFTCLALILVIGAFLRLYHFSDWLHFELDQARDAKIVIGAIQNGIGELPLLGPRAGGTFLRLGPGFYYLEYVGALLFGATPVGVSVIIALFSIASIAAFLFLIRRYFNDALSLVLTMMYSVSAYLVLYGRFSWNPNLLPFFMILGAYALLRAVDISDDRREKWLIISFFSFGMATHMHFLAFVSLPIITALFLIIKRVRFAWKTWALAILSVFLLYVPVFLNETLTGWKNTQEFIEAVQGKSNKNEHTLVEQVFRNTTNHALGYWLVLTGYERADTVDLRSIGTFGVDIKCDGGCRERYLLSGLGAMSIFIIGILLMIWSWHKESDIRRRDFLLLSLLWFIFCFSIFTSLSYDFSPRFFLLTIPFPFIFLGLIASHLLRTLPRKCRALVWIALAAFIVSNIYYVNDRLHQLSRASRENFPTISDKILKEKTRVTLEQQNLILDYMQAIQNDNGYPVYMFAPPEHRRALKYLLDLRGMRNDTLGYSGGIYREGSYFLVLRTGSNQQNNLRKYLPVYDTLEKKSFGTLTVYRFIPKQESITAEKQVFEEEIKSSKSAPGVPERYTWGEWWNNQSGSQDDEVDDEETDDQEL